jgi:DNA polymerase-1
MRLVGFDVETHSVDFGKGLLAPTLVCGSFAWPTSVEGELDYVLHDRDGTLDLIESLLRDPEVTIVAHNSSFDFAVVCAANPKLIPLAFAAFREGRIKDTKTRQELIDIANGRRQDNSAVFVFRGGHWTKADYTLAGLVQLFTGRDRSGEKYGDDAWRLRYGELDGVPMEQWPEAAVEYALTDAKDAVIVYLAQTFNGSIEIPTEDDQARAAWMLHLESCWGIRTEAEAVEKLEALLLQEKAKSFEVLHANNIFKTRRATKEEVEKGEVDLWEDVPPTKTGKERPPRPLRYQKDQTLIRQLVQQSYEKQGRIVPTTDSGAVSMDKDTLKESGDEVLGILGDASGVDKILNTYIPVLKQGTVVPINARFKPLVNSGRTASAEPNLQNLPTGRRVGGVRETFIPRAGYYFLSVDYDTLELRALAQVCLELFGFSELARVFLEGLDPHNQTAANILGITYEQFLANPDKNTRDCAKVPNFGLPGGMGVAALVDFSRKSYNIRLENMTPRRPNETPQDAALRKAQELKNIYLMTYPEMREVYKYVSALSGINEQSAVLTDPVTGYVRGGLGYCDACNHLFQHRAAFGAKAAGFDLAYECYVDESSPLFGSRPVAFIHDEYILEVPIDVATEAAQRTVEVMVAAMRKVVPEVPITASPALMERWYKKAEEVRDASGRLIPWKPKTSSLAA